MECPGCQHPNPPSAKFCSECGARLRTLYPRCEREVLPTARFCSECGAPLATASPATPPAEPRSLEKEFASLQQAMPTAIREQFLTPAEGENRVVTVLFAD